MDGDGHFNTLPRCSRSHVNDSDGFPPLGRINIRSLRPKSQSPTRGSEQDRVGDMPAVSPTPSAVKPAFVRGHRRDPSWRQVSKGNP